MTASSPTALVDLHRLSWVALMAALVASGAFFSIAIGPVPITFQDLFIALAGFVLGPRYGVYSVALYILAGAAGLPVFSGGKSGLGHLAGPTGGYLAGYVLLAFCTGVGSRLAKYMSSGNIPSSSRGHGAAVKARTALSEDMPGTGGTNLPASSEAGQRTHAKGPGPRPRPAILGWRPTLAALGCALVGLFFLYTCGVAWLMHTLDLSLEKALAVGVVPFIPLGTAKVALSVLLWRSLYQRGLIPDEPLPHRSQSSRKQQRDHR